MNLHEFLDRGSVRSAVRALTLLGVLGAAGLAASVNAEPPVPTAYRTGFVWQRSADWTPGIAEGFSFTRGNPDDDALGNLVWSAEWIAGGGPIGSEDEWFRKNSTLMVWQFEPWGEPEPRWLCGIDCGPQVKPDRLDHDLDGPPFELFGGAPLVRWTNPTHRSVNVTISGPFQFFWGGVDDVAVPTIVDAVIAKVDGTTGAVFPMLRASSVKPNDNSTPESTTIEFPNLNAFIGPHDQIIWTVRGRTASATGAWVVLVDHDLKITLQEFNDCEGDFNRDGQVDFFDYLDFVQAFESCPR